MWYTLTGHRSGSRTLAVSLLAMLMLLLLPGAAGAAGPDRLELVRIATVSPDSSSPEGALRFQLEATYALGTQPEGFLMLFLFEDTEQRSSQQSSAPIAIKAGAGRATMDIDYLPDPAVKSLTLIMAMFSPDERLLGWVSTNPMPLADWASRAEFEQAMAARLAGNHAESLANLTQAIQRSPETGNLYYWRGDARTRLGQYDEAVADYSAALELMPGHRASLLGRGVARVWKGDFETALRDLGATIDTAGTPDALSAWAHRTRGVALAVTGRPQEAIGDYEAYLALMPEARDGAVVQGWIAELRAFIAASTSPAG